MGSHATSGSGSTVNGFQHGAREAPNSSSPTISAHTVHTTATPSAVLDLLVIVVLAAISTCGGWWTWLGLAASALWVRGKTNTVLEETILAITGLGLQLSTTRGILLSNPLSSSHEPFKLPLGTSRLFLPLESVSDVVINEGVYGWKIIYYLVVIQKDGARGVKLRVGYPELLPRLAELRKAWQGIRCTLYDELPYESDISKGEDGDSHFGHDDFDNSSNDSEGD